jgi:pyridoxal phosphate enzyme (YggS family)
VAFIGTALRGVKDACSPPDGAKSPPANDLTPSHPADAPADAPESAPRAGSRRDRLRPVSRARRIHFHRPMAPPPPRDPDPARSQELPTAEPAVDRLRRHLTSVYERIDAARARGAHAARAVTLVVVTKAAPPNAFDLLRSVGERDVGENRVQDAVAKRETAPPGLVWHGIGHLQTNKVKKAVRAFDVFHALDSAPLAAAVEDALSAAGRRWPVYVQVNAARDPNKGGVEPEHALALAESVALLGHLDVVGFMTMAKEDDLGERARPCFSVLRELRDEAVRRGIGRVPPSGLSMGMSGDFEVAVEEGATIVRVGHAVWDGSDRARRADAPDSTATPREIARTVGRQRTP